MHQSKLRSVTGFSHPRYKAAMPATTAPNRLQREFTVARSDQVWVTDVTHLRTHWGWLYLPLAIEVHSRAVGGWPMNDAMATELVRDALMIAAWRRIFKIPVMIHSDQGSQFGSHHFNGWCLDYQLVPGINRR